MIGISVEDRHRQTAEEFFQLFKTPWEFAVPGRLYDALLVTTDIPDKVKANLILIYSSRAVQVDSALQVALRPNGTRRLVWSENECFPLYEKSAVLTSPHHSFAFYHGSTEAAGLEVVGRERTILRLGYDLFEEINHLLVQGQPLEWASYPTLDSHINMLRRLLLSAKIPLLEIPPAPAGHPFMAALTHDVDFAGLRAQGGDHSMMGFLYRGTIGSIRRLMTGRLSFKEALRNWLSVLSVPLVLAGWIRDFWLQFDEYIRLEKSHRSTFFIIPFKNRSGSLVHSSKADRRATKYDAEDIPDTIRMLSAAGKEVALHGIDAWHDANAAVEEKRRIEAFTARPIDGARMHWLCFSRESPFLLDREGFGYDSTVGYNETIGFRSGTLQVFRPLGCTRLLELPLHVQDVAMFFGDSKNWKPKIARRHCFEILDKAVKYGGVVTLLWHERSLGPERQWGGFYKMLLGELERRKAWITSASEIVAWFRCRRQVRFSNIQQSELGVRVELERPDAKPFVPLVVRYHSGDTGSFIDTAFLNEPELFIPRPGFVSPEGVGL